MKANADHGYLKVGRLRDAVRRKGGLVEAAGCMSWRLNKADFDKQKGTHNKEAMRRIVEQDEPPGLLAYLGGKAIGWCAVAQENGHVRNSYKGSNKLLQRRGLESLRHTPRLPIAARCLMHLCGRACHPLLREDPDPGQS